MSSRDGATRPMNRLATKETFSMMLSLKRLALALLTAASLSAFALPSAGALAAPSPSPWWQLLTASRPTHMWTATDNVQEVTAEKDPAKQILVAKIEVDGKVIGCLGTGSFFGQSADFWCNFLGYAPQATDTAEELEQVLEPAFGTTAVEVTGGPVAANPFLVTTPDRSAPTIHLDAFSNQFNTSFGSASSRPLSPGGSGRLVLTLTNLGDAPVDATSTPVTIIDRLPAGVEATGVEAFAGPLGSAGTVTCDVVPAEVSCDFEGELPSYEAIEIEVLVSLTDEPPTQVGPGKVTVTGGNAPSTSAVQNIEVSPEPAPFGLEYFSARAEEEAGVEEERGTETRQAGSHPLQFTTTIQLNSASLPGARKSLEQPALPRNLRFSLPAGFIGNARAMPTCPMVTFLTAKALVNECSDSAALGAASVTVIEGNLDDLLRVAVPVFNLPPSHGEPARFGFMPLGVPVTVDTEVDPDNESRIIASVRNTTQAAKFLASTVTLWGAPGDPRHDASRGWNCVLYILRGTAPCQRPPDLPETAYLRMPVQCASPLDFKAEIEPWNSPIGSLIDSASLTSAPLEGCNKVPFDPSIDAAPTSKLAENPSGLDFRLAMPNHNLLNKDGIAEGQAKKVEVELPKGMTVNPSEGEGLVGCSPDEYARETASSTPGEGCPDASKIGTIQISTPLLEEEAHGSLYVASPFDNPTGSLLALYVVARIPERGIVVKQAGSVKPDPVTGQLTSTFDDLPQLPFSEFRLHFKEGARAPLVTPAACGTYDVVARFTPWHAADPNNPKPAEIITETSSFKVERGVDGGACPAGGIPPFHPSLLAGTINNAAGRYSPFNLRLTRKDGEQEFTNFSIKLPPGVVGKLAGVGFCSDAAIAAAKARTGRNGGAEELSSPSCPANSQVGRTLVGAGVGTSLTYVPGKLYLAGPYHGSPLSVVAITAAKVGPFDLGTVVLREALRINPVTAEVFVDPTNSDPIPHIIQGIPVHARDIRAYVDRPQFVLNPTSCERTSTASTVLGSGRDFGSSADDVPVTVTSPFQAADCANLGFKPRLKLRLRGSTTRGGNPALRAVLRPRKDDANAARISVALPHSEFLDQGHIRTVCTRVQFKAGSGNGSNCPAGSIYGRARVWTPLFDQPLEGPVFLRSSEHPLPDLVLALHGLVDIQAVGRIDSVNGGIRTTFDFVPDAPVTKAVLNMQGGRKSLLQNSTNICRGKHRATVKMKGHNGKLRNFRAPLRAKCSKRHGKHR